MAANVMKYVDKWETISPADDFSGLRIFEIINHCAGKHYKGWATAWYDINDDYALWFPKISSHRQDADMKAYGFKGYNLLSADGKTLTQADPSKPPKTIKDEMNTEARWYKKRLVFGRINGSFHFLGIFVLTNEVDSSMNYLSEITRRIGTEFDLRTFQYVDTSTTTPKKTWLLTWNPENWKWETYAKDCDNTKLGLSHVEPWTCQSHEPELGDEVYLIKLGKLPRGIVAHGKVVRISYDAPHYDSEKAAKGEIANHIDVEFDQIRNYETESILSQYDLNEQFPDQHWSPQGSGICIVDSVAHDLKEQWKNLVGPVVTLTQSAEHLSEEINDTGLEGEDKEALVKVRVNQGIYRDRLLSDIASAASVVYLLQGLLRASHIKPWIKSENIEKLDVDNGFLLCPNHDLLFDQGYISFDDDGKIMISPELPEIDRVFMNVNANMKIELTEGNKKCLEYHRKYIFKKQG